jgi:RNA polymerase sigma factor (sigma-70 family)
MAEGSDSGREGVRLRMPDMAAAAEVNAWFGREVLPLEAALMEFLQHNWRNQSDVYDFRQEVYVRVYEAALKKIPDRPKQFVFAIARNFLIDQVRRAHIIPIETATDLEALEIAVDLPWPDRVVMARDELRRLQAALDKLPPRCREAVVLGRIEGLSGRQIAARMNIAEGTVSEYLANGICALVDILYGEPPTNRRKM